MNCVSVNSDYGVDWFFIFGRIERERERDLGEAFLMEVEFTRENVRVGKGI